MPRDVKRIENQMLFREVNERVRDLNRTFADIADGDDGSFVCECGDLRCHEQIKIPMDAYAMVRSDPALFVVVPSHRDRTVEVAVEEHPGYAIVRLTREDQPAAGPYLARSR